MGSSPKIEMPAAPAAVDAKETTKEMIQAQIDSLPDILKAQAEYGPQFTALQIEQLQKYAPDLLTEQIKLEKEFGGQLAEATRAETEILAPERIAASELLAKYLQEEETLTPEEERLYREDIRSAQSTRGLAESGFGAIDEVRQLTALRQQLKQQKLNIALSSAGLIPTNPGASINAPQQQQLVQNVSPSDYFDLVASSYATQGNIFGSQVQGQLGQLNAKVATRGQNMDLAGSIIGGSMSMYGNIAAANAKAAAGAIAGSSIDYKENITENEYDSIAVLAECDIKNFDYKEKMNMPNKRYVGVIAENAPDILTTEDKKAFDLYSAVGVLIDAVNKIEKRLKAIEEK